METTAFLFHDESGESVGRMPLQAGDDAKALKWIDISSEINLYASHKEFIEKAVYKLGAHWWIKHLWNFTHKATLKTLEKRPKKNQIHSAAF